MTNPVDYLEVALKIRSIEDMPYSTVNMAIVRTIRESFSIIEELPKLRLFTSCQCERICSMYLSNNKINTLSLNLTEDIVKCTTTQAVVNKCCLSDEVISYRAMSIVLASIHKYRGMLGVITPTAELEPHYKFLMDDCNTYNHVMQNGVQATVEALRDFALNKPKKTVKIF